MKELVRFRGHENITALHPKTLEITTSPHLTRRGDCIIGVDADKGAASLDEGVKRALQRDGAPVRFTVQVGEARFSFMAQGSSALRMASPEAIIIRRTSFTNCLKTVAIRAECAASDLPRQMVEALRRGEQGLLIIEPL